jgi:hypothetical protein
VQVLTPIGGPRRALGVATTPTTPAATSTTAARWDAAVARARRGPTLELDGAVGSRYARNAAATKDRAHGAVQPRPCRLIGQHSRQHDGWRNHGLVTVAVALATCGRVLAVHDGRRIRLLEGTPPQ